MLIFASHKTNENLWYKVNWPETQSSLLSSPARKSKTAQTTVRFPTLVLHINTLHPWNRHLMTSYWRWMWRWMWMRCTWVKLAPIRKLCRASDVIGKALLNLDFCHPRKSGDQTSWGATSVLGEARPLRQLAVLPDADSNGWTWIRARWIKRVHEDGASVSAIL